MRVYDNNLQLAYTEDNIDPSSDLQRTVAGLADNAQYAVSIWADNGVDTNYNVYTANINIIANPVAVGNLAKISMSGTQANLRFSYSTALFDIAHFLLTVHDVSLLGSGSVDSGYAIINPASQSSIVNGVYTYAFVLTPQSSFIPDMTMSDKMVLHVYSVNSSGMVSPIGNTLVINP